MQGETDGNDGVARTNGGIASESARDKLTGAASRARSFS